MDISLNELKLFCKVAEEGNISKAAVSIGVTQPTLSWAIRKLEKKLDLVLFARGKKGVMLTKAGETLLLRSRPLLGDWENLVNTLHEDEEEIRGQFALGIHSTVAGYALPRFLGDLFSKHPHIQIKMEHDFSRHIAQGVINGKFDFGIVVNPPQHPDLTIVDLYPDAIRFWTLPEPGPAQQPQSPNSVISCNPDMLATPPLLKEALESGVLRGRRVLYSSELTVIAGTTAAGATIGLLPTSTAKLYSGGKLIPVEDGPVTHTMVCLVWRGDLQRSKAARVIRGVIVDGLRNLKGPAQK